MNAGIARTGRTLLAVLVAASLLLSMMFLLADPAARADHSPTPDFTVAQINGPDGTNEPGYWETFLEAEGLIDVSCAKIDQAGDAAYVLGDPPTDEIWAAVIIKQATTNFVYLAPESGHAYPSVGANAPGFSHIIVCSMPEPVTTTTEESTTTTVEISDSTVTTEVEDTTTTTLVEETTTTTIEDEVLDSTITTASSTSSSIEDEVLDEELPFTGIESEHMALLAGAFALLGSLLLISTRRIEE